MHERSWLPVLRLRQIPPAVWALGFVSLLMDISSEIIHALLPVYLVTVLGASMLTVGVHRRHCRSHSLDYQGVFRRALGLVGQAQVSCCRRLWTCGIHQADIPPCIVRKLAGCGAFHRPYWKRHPRSAPGRVGRGYCPRASARRELRTAAVA